MLQIFESSEANEDFLACSVKSDTLPVASLLLHDIGASAARPLACIALYIAS
jgi:hypothetical protein